MKTVLKGTRQQMVVLHKMDRWKSSHAGNAAQKKKRPFTCCMIRLALEKERTEVLDKVQMDPSRWKEVRLSGIVALSKRAKMLNVVCKSKQAGMS